jgi:hypothetical protein
MLTSPRRRLAVIGVAAASVALAGLATPAAGAPAQKVKNACGLLDAAEIQQVFGVPVEEGEKTTDLAGTGTQCEWQIGDPDGTGMNGTLTARLQRGSGPTGAKAAYDVGKKQSLEGDGTEVDGFGRDAYYDPFTGTLDVLKNKKTGFYLQGIVFASGAAKVAPDELQAQLQDLAELAIERA